jgi:hypothetical protein
LCYRRNLGIDTAPLLQADWYYKKLEAVLRQLQQDIPDAKYDQKSLAQLIAHLEQFMEDALGINVSSSPPYVVIESMASKQGFALGSRSTGTRHEVSKSPKCAYLIPWEKVSRRTTRSVWLSATRPK